MFIKYPKIPRLISSESPMPKINPNTAETKAMIKFSPAKSK